MRTTLAGVAALALLLGAAGPKPAAALPIADPGLRQADAAQSGYVTVQWRRHHWRRYGYWGPRYRAYGYDPYYRRHYYGGPRFHVGPRGFSFGFGW